MSDSIHIVEYDPTWPAKFELEKERLMAALSAFEILGIEHFGSTAIPNLSAKPIIDILIAVPSIMKARETLPPVMDALGYDFWSDNPKRDRLFFVKGMPPRGIGRTHHVHICEKSGEMWHRLKFRDYLRENSDAAREYESLKTQLAKQHADDREAYTDAKAEFVSRIMQLVDSL